MSAGFETKSSASKKRNHDQVKPRQVASIEAIQQSLVENFGDIKDKRVERTKKHGVAESWDDFAQFRTNFQRFQTPIHPAFMQREVLILPKIPLGLVYKVCAIAL
jgi:hypothetical protein